MSLYNKVSVRVHIATFTTDMMKMPYFFVNIRNGYKRRNIVVTDIWFFTESYQPLTQYYTISLPHKLINEGRPLPTVIHPQSTWETWIKVHDVHFAGVNNVLVRLSNGRYLTSSKRKGISQSGIVPGGE